MTETKYLDEIQTGPAQVQHMEQSSWCTVTNPEAFLGYRCQIRLQPETQGYSTYVAELPGVVSQGDSAEEAIKNTIEALRAALSTYGDSKMPIPWREPEELGAGEERVWVEVNG